MAVTSRVTATRSTARDAQTRPRPSARNSEATSRPRDSVRASRAAATPRPRPRRGYWTVSTRSVVVTQPVDPVAAVVAELVGGRVTQRRVGALARPGRQGGQVVGARQGPGVAAEARGLRRGHGPGRGRVLERLELALDEAAEPGAVVALERTQGLDRASPLLGAPGWGASVASRARIWAASVTSLARIWAASVTSRARIWACSVMFLARASASATIDWALTLASSTVWSAIRWAITRA